MSKMKDGPTKNAVKQKALGVLEQKKQYVVEVIISVKILFISNQFMDKWNFVSDLL